MSGEENWRLFVALALPDGLRRRLAKVREGVLAERWPPARWIPAENVHLTLLFLGDRPARRVPSLLERVAAAASDVPPLELRLQGLGAFPQRGRARVLWLGLEGPPDLARLQRRVEQSLSDELGTGSSESERQEFRPHLTVARCRRPWRRSEVEECSNGFRELTGLDWSADRVTLYRSHLDPRGARYEVVGEAELGSALGIAADASAREAR